MSQRQKKRDEVAGEKQGAGSMNKVKHMERNDQLFVTRMM